MKGPRPGRLRGFLWLGFLAVSAALPAQSLEDRTRVGDQLYQRGKIFQPKLHFGNRAEGFRKYWDKAEESCPQALRVGKSFRPEDIQVDLAMNQLGDLASETHREHFARRGAVYYLDLPFSRGSEKFVAHRYYYFFPQGSTVWGTRLPAHGVWVDVVERVEAGPNEIREFQERERTFLEARKKSLLGALETLPKPARAEVQDSLSRLEGILQGLGPLPLAARSAVEVVWVSAPTPLDQEVQKVTRYGPTQLTWWEDRPALYVTEGNHRFLGSLEEKTGWEELDPPFLTEPRGGLPRVDLRSFSHPENPIGARARGEDVPSMPGFFDSPIFLQGLWLGSEDASRGLKVTSPKVSSSR